VEVLSIPAGSCRRQISSQCDGAGICLGNLARSCYAQPPYDPTQKHRPGAPVLLCPGETRWGNLCFSLFARARWCTNCREGSLTVWARMTPSKSIACMALAALVCAGRPQMACAQQSDPREYKAPVDDRPADDLAPPVIAPPDQDTPAAAAPEVTFRDRLLRLQTLGPGANPRTQISTPDTTSSYSTSGPVGSTTRDTTSSYTTGDSAVR
jgi:hypothetical protein